MTTAKQMTRADLLKLVRQEVRTSAFERLTVNSIYNQLHSTQKKATSTAAAVSTTSNATTTRKKEKSITGVATGSLVKFQPNGYYFGVTLDFALAKQEKFGSVTPNPSPALTTEEKADWGTGFGNPLVGPHKNCVYVVRATIEQLRVDPMIGGFKLKWVAPAGWSRMDPLPWEHLVEASSNSLLVARKFKSPSSTIKNVVFRVFVTAWYP